MDLAFDSPFDFSAFPLCPSCLRVSPGCGGFLPLSPGRGGRGERSAHSLWRPKFLVSGAIFAVNKAPIPPPVAEREDTPLGETFPLTPFLRGRGNGDGLMYWSGKCAGWRNPVNHGVFRGAARDVQVCSLSPHRREGWGERSAGLGGGFALDIAFRLWLTPDSRFLLLLESRGERSTGWRGRLPMNKPMRKIVIGQPVAREKVKLARRLRSQMTEEEKRLWQRLRAKRLDGFRFRRQQIIDGFIVDFYCNSVGLVIEVDGEIHRNQVVYDSIRDDIVKTRGLHVLRVSNAEIRTNLDGVLESIRAYMEWCQRNV